MVIAGDNKYNIQSNGLTLSLGLYRRNTNRHTDLITTLLKNNNRQRANEYPTEIVATSILNIALKVNINNVLDKASDTSKTIGARIAVKVV